VGCLSWPDFHFEPVYFLSFKTIFMTHKARLKNIMVISWEIQRRKKCIRSKALLAAWAIIQHEDITVYYLVRKHSHDRYANKVQPESIGLFK
jgi:hypothetical protein